MLTIPFVWMIYQERREIFRHPGQGSVLKLSVKGKILHCVTDAFNYFYAMAYLNSLQNYYSRLILTLLLVPYIIKKEIWCSSQMTFSYPALQLKKILLSTLYLNLNFIFCVLQLNKSPAFIFIVCNFLAQFPYFACVQHHSSNFYQ